MRITAPTGIQGNPSPRVGKRSPLPPAVTAFGRVDDEVDGAGAAVVDGREVTV